MDDRALTLLLLDAAEAGTTPEELDEGVEPMCDCVFVGEDEILLTLPDVSEVHVLTSPMLDELAGGILDIVFVV